MTFAEPPPTPLSGSADFPESANSPRPPAVTPHDWVSDSDESLGPNFVLPGLTPPFLEDPWPITPADIDDLPKRRSAEVLETIGAAGGAPEVPDDSSATCNPRGAGGFHPAGENPEDLEFGRDEDTVAGVAANSNRANRVSFKKARTVGGGAGGASGALGGGRNLFPLRRLIGRGGYGEVWEAIQINLGRPVAVKHLRPDVLEQTRESRPQVAAALERAFENEALTAAMLEHPNIVPVYDLSTDPDGTSRLAMKLVRGATWHESLQSDFESSMNVADFLAHHLLILLSISQAVAFAHSRGVVHRDLKPSQVMVGEFGEVLLMDWGIAAVFDTESALQYMPGLAPEQSLATMQGPAGTPAFMAPEQTQTSQAGVGPWTDIYLLGGILYQILCGKPPHGAATGKLAFKQATEGKVEAPSLVVGGKREIPPALEELAMECLSIQPTDRPKSVKAFIKRIEEYLSGAGRRREAEELRHELLRRLPQAGGDYGELARLDAMALKARVLAPENRHLADTHELILSSYVKSALDHGDYMLARQQAERVENGAERAQLLEMVAAMEERQSGGRRQRRAAIIATAGMALTLLVAGARNTYERIVSERDRTRAEFLRNSDQIQGQFLAALRETQQALNSVAAFRVSHPTSTEPQFQSFAESLLRADRSGLVMLYSPVVEAADREEFERSIRNSSAGADGIRERRQNRYDIRAGARAAYVPVRFVAPMERAEEFMGLDLLSVGQLGPALERAAQTLAPAATGQVDIANGFGGKVALVIPVVREAQVKPEGFVVGFWTVSRMLEQCLMGWVGDSHRVRLLDNSGNPNQPIPLGEAGSGAVALGESGTQVSRYSINMAGRRLTLEVGAPPHATDRDVLRDLLGEVILPVLSILVVLAGVAISRMRMTPLMKGA